MPQRHPDSLSPADLAAALAAHAAMVAELRRPGACAGEPTGAGLIETHLSSLLLAGDQVYKLKKPLRNAFVDFSTLEARCEACEQELRLNRRTAPRWYLRVMAVRRLPGGATLTAPGDPVAVEGPVIDWAVQMRRFDDRQRLDRLAQAGQLSASMVDSLAAVVARFHAQQSPAPPGFGRAETTRHWARENLRELAALAPDAAARAQVAALADWTEQRGAALASLMDLRCRTGHVREVHGDLHLGNVVWFEGAPVLFDALEFNDTLRHIDTLGDLAFTFMDLQAHGLSGLAWRFISAALEASGDWAALPLLSWWAVYRATVRAKVTLMGAVVASQARAQAQRYLDLAMALAGLDGAESAPPRLVMSFGLAGAGKSTVALALAECLGGVRLRSDVERKRLFSVPPTARAVPGLYSADATRRTYDRLQDLARAALAAGVSVVVDAASLRRSERDAMRAVATQTGACFTLLVCDAAPGVLAERVRQRMRAGDDASDATPELLALQQSMAEWPGGDEAAYTLRIATDPPWPVLRASIEVLAKTLAKTPRD